METEYSENTIVEIQYSENTIVERQYSENTISIFFFIMSTGKHIERIMFTCKHNGFFYKNKLISRKKTIFLKFFFS